ncbi:TPA: hypothetical protein JLS24_000524 [Escherichia coli]|nr:hypothetical protein [Escherichia coli]
MTPSELSDLLWAQVDRVAPHLLPNGKKEGHEWVAGNVNGDKGNSLKVNLSGKKKWADFAEGDGGDMLDLWMACRGINLHQAMQEAKAFLGIKDDDHHFDAKREKKFSRPDRKKIARYVTRTESHLEYQSLAAAEATGGLGSTATSNQLATIAPTLGQSWLSNQMSNYNNLANIGLGALQGQANAGQTYANNMSSIAQQSAALAAANANKPSSLQTAISGGTSGAIAGAGLASLLGTSTPWGAGIGAGIGLLGSLF